MGVYWEFVIFTISFSPNGKPLAMFTNFEIRPLKCSFSCGFIKILSQRYFCTLSSFIFYHLNAFFNAQLWANQAIIILRGILSYIKKQDLNNFLPYILKPKRRPTDSHSPHRLCGSAHKGGTFIFGLFFTDNKIFSINFHNKYSAKCPFWDI